MKRTMTCLIAVFGITQQVSSQTTYDVVVYGGTSGGVVAAVQAAKMGKSAVLIEPGQHLGGLTSGGLGATDIGNKKAIGGISRDFYRLVAQHYDRDEAWKFQSRDSYRSRRQQTGEDTMWTFEPHVAERIFNQMVREANVPVVYGERLDLSAGVRKHGSRIHTIVMESGRTFQARMFIDATYEGDLLAKAGVSYHVGREANSVYDETLNGVQPHRRFHQFNKPVDPYVVRGDSASGLLPGIHDGDPGQQGAGDHRVQAYNFRLCMTDVAENQIPFPKPEGYDPLRYELLRRYIQAGVFDAINAITPMPNRKTDMNNDGGFSTDNIGMNYEYPDGDYQTREKILAEHVAYQQGLMWFLANDPQLPEEVHRAARRWGLCKDEFTDLGGWPHQMYVREARRMISDYVMTQHNCQGRIKAEDPVGLAAYTMDSHNVQRYVENGRAINEGDVQVGGFPPYPISYRCIVPKRSECTNLLVPVCLSASHIAYGSIRMEPVFMVLGQSAATAAVLAIDSDCDLQDVAYDRLQRRLLADHQMLEWTGPSPAPRPVGIEVEDLQGIVVDDEDAELTGVWSFSGSAGPFVANGYHHDGDQQKGSSVARYVARLPHAGRWEVGLCYSPHGNRATNVPVTVHAAERETTLKVNQRVAPPRGEAFFPLGVFSFKAGQAVVTVSNRDTDGYVIADAVRFTPVDANAE